ncbi:alpha-2-macroglobulin-like protein [Plakobranchus ocellatus]|uniref:Alpha-2-macroglobulin-like protein n=1 Tax=Plakobranchus ocellatus TaxID=259542 RepID=A0AAV4CWL6_9GAST|nr:alpha-2-macroglobulin-like protein [Plakobranchus ocellatus]
MARGQVVTTGQFDPKSSATQGAGTAMPLSDMCLQKTEAESDRKKRDDGITDPGVSERGPFPKTYGEEIQTRDSNDIAEPIVRPEHVSDMVFNFPLHLEIKPIMSPEFTLLLYYLMADGEVVADSMQYNVEPCFENKVKIEFNEGLRGYPEQEVHLKLEAAPGSECAVDIVPKSVPQISPAKMLDKIGEFKNYRFRPNTDLYENENDYCTDRLKKNHGPGVTDGASWKFNSLYVDSVEAFKLSTSLVLTDLDLQTRPCRKLKPDISARRRDSETLIYSIGDDRDIFTPIYPETWFWSFVSFKSSCFILLAWDYSEKVPAKVTNWTASIVCLSKEKGFGMSSTSLTVVQPISVEVRLPNTAVKGERVRMMVKVYNHVGGCLPVQVTITGTGKIKVRGVSFRHTVCSCENKPFSSTYVFRAKVQGTIPVTTNATVVPGECQGRRRDVDDSFAGVSHEVTRNILVKDKGVEMSYTYATYLCSGDGKPLLEKVELPLPKGKEIIRNSAHGEVQVIGDIMGAALNNLEYLVRMPTGCGEQNMIKFVSNILVLNYLNSTGNLQETRWNAALNEMEIDYQHALNYRRKDGSFSAFGEKDPSGSVWLTSFVVKSFAQANKHIFIDKNVLQRSVDFLVRNQLEIGCFRETGRVISSYMIGWLGEERGQKNRNTLQGALTAYVLMALLETGLNTKDQTIERGIYCLNFTLRNYKDKLDPYTLALITLAFMKYKSASPDAKYAFELLHRKARKDDNHIYWTRGNSMAPSRTKFYPSAPSAEVETASYALMSYNQLHPKHAGKIASWLSRQRNSFGGFSSTQDTVVALDALSQFGATTYCRDPTDLKVKVMFKNTAAASSVEFCVSEVENNTRFLLQSKPIPALPSTLYISTNGTGCALVQANVRYNQPARTYVKGEKLYFHLKIHVKPYQHDPDKCDYRKSGHYIWVRTQLSFYPYPLLTSPQNKISTN